MSCSSSSKIYDVAIIGGGIMGSATAYYLSKSNQNIILLEQFDFLHRKGSSHGDSRIIRQTYPQDHYTELMLSAYPLWSSLEKESGSKLFTKTGGLDIGLSSNPLLISLLKAARKNKVQHQVITSSEELTKRFPTLSFPPQRGTEDKKENYIAIYTPSSGILNVTKALSVFQSLARKNGATLKDNSKVLGFFKDVFCIQLNVETSGGGFGSFGDTSGFSGKSFATIRAKKVIFTTGPWTQKILQSNLNFDLPLSPEQTTIAYWRVETPHLYSSESFPVFIHYEDPLIYGTPAHEFPNMIKCAVHRGKIIKDMDSTDPNCQGRDFEPGKKELMEEVVPFLQKFFKGVNPEPVLMESCVYTWSPDHNFIIDEVPGAGGRLWVGCGFSGHGFKLAPIVGQILTSLVLKGINPYPKTKKFFSIERLMGVKPGNAGQSNYDQSKL